MKHITYTTSWLCGLASLVLFSPALPVQSAAPGVGDLAPNFTLPRYRTGELVSLTNFAGSVVLLEFFYEACPVCQSAAPSIKSQIRDYYAARGAAVKVIHINIADVSTDPDTDLFIFAYGMDFVLNDRPPSPVFQSFGTPYTPLFVVINGRASTGRPRQWEVIYKKAGFYDAVTVDELRAAMDSALDTTPPTVSITSPPAGTEVGTPNVALAGTATDNKFVAAVEFKLINALTNTAFQLAQGTTSWTATVSNLAPGTNIIRVRARDGLGNVSARVDRPIVYFPRAMLTLVTNGAGGIGPNLTNLNLNLGQSYTLTAMPAPDYVFYNWSAGVPPGPLSIVSASPQYTFTMQTGLWVQANFIVSPFKAVAGTYQGLYYGSGGAEAEGSGAFRLTVTKRGLYSAEVRHDLDTEPLSGQFGLDGKATNVLFCDCMNATFRWQLDLNQSRSNYLTGVVTDNEGGWEAILLGDLAPAYGTNASPYQGKYTVVLAGTHDPDNTNQPAGDSYASVSVDAAGRLAFIGSLADGKPAVQGAQVCAKGIAPLYVPLYGGEGMLISWVQLSTNTPPASPVLSPVALWERPASSNAAYYPQGFEVITSISGSKYTKNASPILPFRDGVVTFAGGNLPSNVVHSVTLTESNTVLSRPALSMSITRSNGMFGGTFKVPGTTNRIGFGGVIVQGQTNGSGFFRYGGRSGWVHFGPASM